MQNQCPFYNHLDHIQYRCTLQFNHPGAHAFTEMVPLTIYPTAIDPTSETVTEITREANEDLAIYTPEDIRRAMWLALDDLITEHTDDLSLLITNSEYENYLKLVYDRWDSKRKKTLAAYDANAGHYGWLPVGISRTPYTFAETLNDAALNCDAGYPELAAELRNLATVMPSQWQAFNVFFHDERQALARRDWGKSEYGVEQYEYARDGMGYVFARRLLVPTENAEVLE